MTSESGEEILYPRNIHAMDVSEHPFPSEPLQPHEESPLPSPSSEPPSIKPEPLIPTPPSPCAKPKSGHRMNLRLIMLERWFPNALYRPEVRRTRERMRKGHQENIEAWARVYFMDRWTRRWTSFVRGLPPAHSRYLQVDQATFKYFPCRGFRVRCQ